jgi:hypothetical protein
VFWTDIWYYYFLAYREEIVPDFGKQENLEMIRNTVCRLSSNCSKKNNVKRILHTQ